MNSEEKIKSIKHLIESTNFVIIEDAARCLIDIIKIAYQ